ncbi:MAG: transmembrane 220 family protein [Bacteroidota bacterium]
MKVTNLILAVVFLLFAYFQVNDPDPYLWMLLYFFLAAVCLFSAYGRRNKYIIWMGIAGCTIWIFLLLPEFINWINMGMPNIAGQMKAEEPHIEFTREFLGLGICLAVLFWQLRKVKR